MVLYDLDSKFLQFVDDLLIMSRSFDMHLNNLREIFTRFRDNDVTLNFEKSKFFQEKIKFLGHIFTKDGIKPDPEKINAIKNFPRPRNVRQMRGFLEALNFYSRFSNQYAKEAGHLIEMIKKGMRWKWTKERNEAF